jgi:hypothetical protein
VEALSSLPIRCTAKSGTKYGTKESPIAVQDDRNAVGRLPGYCVALRDDAAADRLAVRVVSGFLCEFHVDVKDRRGGEQSHAWVDVFLPGAGWVGIDPTNGTFCDHRFIPTAVGTRMADIAPIQGSYFGEHRSELIRISTSVCWLKRI